jgi:hypothetical protein
MERVGVSDTGLSLIPGGVCERNLRLARTAALLAQKPFELSR